jgi:protein-disulfide isomerase
MPTRRSMPLRPLSRVAALLGCAWLAGCTVTGGSAGITREQADAILVELREIRRALAEQPRARPAEQAREPQAVRVRAEGGAAIGDPSATVTVVEYTDYQCPFCKRHHDRTFAELRKRYVDTGRIRYVVRDLPLSFHAMAEPAAAGARCAGEQGRFWEARDALFEVSAELSADVIRTKMLGLGLDAARYDACVANPATLAAVKADQDEAAAAGITGTPSFVVGRAANGTIEGTVVSGAQPYGTFAARLDALLAEAPAAVRN